MKNKLAMFFLLLAFMTNGFSQDISKFNEAFSAALDKSFDEKTINDYFSRYSNLLTPETGTTQLMAGLKNENLVNYPLSNFKTETLYKDNIDKLLNSENSYQRLFAYLVIGSANDLSKEQILLGRLKTEKEKGNLIWCGMALMSLKTRHTTDLFDFIVKNENFGDAHMIPLLFQLDTDSLRETAYKRYNSPKVKAKILAIQLLSRTGKNLRTEQIVMDAVRNWDMNIKGYAIFTVKELQIGNLLETFKPLLQNKKTRKIALSALANSPAAEDKEFLFNLAKQKDSIPEELLVCFFESHNIEMVRFWLQLVKNKNLEKDYFFSVTDNRLQGLKVFFQ